MGRSTISTELALRLARKHLGAGTMESSARFCMAEAIEAANEGALVTAIRLAHRSLLYSVGAFHAETKKVAAMIAAIEEIERVATIPSFRKTA